MNSAAVISSVAFLNASGHMSVANALAGFFLALAGSSLGKLFVVGANPKWRQKRELWFLSTASIVLAAVGLFVSRS